MPPRPPSGQTWMVGAGGCWRVLVGGWMGERVTWLCCLRWYCPLPAHHLPPWRCLHRPRPAPASRMGPCPPHPHPPPCLSGRALGLRGHGADSAPPPQHLCWCGGGQRVPQGRPGDCRLLHRRHRQRLQRAGGGRRPCLRRLPVARWQPAAAAAAKQGEHGVAQQVAWLLGRPAAWCASPTRVGRSLLPVTNKSTQRHRRQPPGLPHLSSV